MDIAQEDFTRLRALAVWRQLADEPVAAGLGHKGQGGTAGPSDQRLLQIKALQAAGQNQSLSQNGASRLVMR